jgi:hypothetical protein
VIVVLLLNLALVAVTVTIHYWALYGATRLMPLIRARHHYRIVLGVFGALVAHVLEIWVFAFAYFFLNRAEGLGSLAGNFDDSLFACVYFSFSTYTTVGFGDIYPEGLLRMTTGVEGLTGLVLITWTASFLFLEMQRHWQSA